MVKVFVIVLTLSLVLVDFGQGQLGDDDDVEQNYSYVMEDKEDSEEDSYEDSGDETEEIKSHVRPQDANEVSWWYKFLKKVNDVFSDDEKSEEFSSETKNLINKLLHKAQGSTHKEVSWWYKFLGSLNDAFWDDGTKIKQRTGAVAKESSWWSPLLKMVSDAFGPSNLQAPVILYKGRRNPGR